MCAVVNKRIMVENNGSSIRERIPSINTKNNSAKFFFGGLQIVRNISYIVSSKEKGLKILIPTFFEVGQATVFTSTSSKAQKVINDCPSISKRCEGQQSLTCQSRPNIRGRLPSLITHTPHTRPAHTNTHTQTHTNTHTHTRPRAPPCEAGRSSIRSHTKTVTDFRP
jgi:hypothetical protein